MLIEKLNQCPYRSQAHENLAYAIYTNGDWCYSCNKGSIKDRNFIEHVPHPAPMIDVKLPVNRSTSLNDFPTHILAWLYNFYVYDTAIRQHMIMYCPPEEFITKNGLSFSGESIIYPVVADNRIVAYTRRFFPNKSFYSYGVQHIIAEFGNHKSGTVVLVEDYISAIRVSQFENCIWIQGTQLTKKLISYIMQNYSNVILWLDGDEPGQQGAQKAINQLTKFAEKEAISRAFAVREQRTVRNIYTQKDPKEYSPNEIREVLYDN